MRLIDADALKKRVDEVFFNDEVEFKDLIDNAPTVFDCRSCKNNGNERECVDCHDYCNFVRYEARPQGEWKITEAYPHKVYCSECYKTYAHEDWEAWKDFSLSRAFCPNCGADMRGGVE